MNYTIPLWKNNGEKQLLMSDHETNSRIKKAAVGGGY